MNIDSLNYIITARHYAEQMGCTSTFGRILKMRDDMYTRKRLVLPMQQDKFAADPVQGFIENGQWIARCECGGCEFVDPDEDVFYCFGCCNRGYNHMLRHVVFPETETRQEIERVLLLRPADDMRGQGDLERAGLAKALIHVQRASSTLPLTRSWNADETLGDLHSQQDEAIAAWSAAQTTGMFIFKEGK